MPTAAYITHPYAWEEFLGRLKSLQTALEPKTAVEPK
jgi:hypothetical protein